MKKILVIESSPRGSESMSRKLTAAIVTKLKAAHAGAEVKVHDLCTHPYPHLEESHLAAFFTPPEKHTEANKKAIAHSDKAIAELFAADIIVLGAPMYNFGVPSVLKAWIDHICRAGKTFKYGDKGPVGLLTGKKLYIAEASGGIYSEGPSKGYDFVAPYLAAVFGFLGVSDIETLRAEGVAVPGVKEHALEKGIAAFK